MLKNVDLDFNGYLDKELQLNYDLKKFPCGEFSFCINEEVSMKDVAIYQSFSVNNFNNDLIKLQIVCDVLKKNNVKSISYISYFLPYIRQDKYNKLNSSCGLEFISNILNKYFNKIITYDLHSQMLADFINCKITNMSAIPLFLEKIKNNFNLKDSVVVFPDNGAFNRFSFFLKDIDIKKITIEKIRINDDIVVKSIQLNDVSGFENAIIIDDIIDTGGTIIETCNNLIKNGIKNIYIYATHGIFSNNALDKLNELECIKKITISNSINNNINDKHYKLDIINL